MGMSTRVVGFKPPDGKWKEMRAIWDACEKGLIEIPDKVLEFFNHIPPDNAGVIVDLNTSDGVVDWAGEDSAGYQIEIQKLPPDIKFVRVYNSW